MNDSLFAFFDIGLVFALGLGLAIWQLVVLKRGIRRDRAETATRAKDTDTEGYPPHRAQRGIRKVSIRRTSGLPNRVSDRLSCTGRTASPRRVEASSERA